jgi:hypothetical protein
VVFVLKRKYDYWKYQPVGETTYDTCTTCMYVLKGNFANKLCFYIFFLMYKYGCLYVYYRFIMLDKGMKSTLKFGQR